MVDKGNDIEFFFEKESRHIKGLERKNILGNKLADNSKSYNLS